MKKNNMTKTLLLLVIALGMNVSALLAQVKIGDNPEIINESAILEMESSSKAVLLPRLTTEQRNSLSSPKLGMIIYNITKKCFEGYVGLVNGSHQWGCLTNENDPQSQTIAVTSNGFTGAYIPGIELTSENTVRFTLSNNSFSAISDVDFSDAVSIVNGGVAIVVDGSANNSVSLASGATTELVYTLSSRPQEGTLTAYFDKLGAQADLSTTVGLGNATIADKTKYVASVIYNGTEIQGKINNFTDKLRIQIPYTAGEGSYTAVTATANTVAGEDGESNGLTLSIPAGTFNVTGNLMGTITVDGDGEYLVKKMAPGAEYTIASFAIDMNGTTYNVIIKGAGGVPDRAFGDGIHDFVYTPVVAEDGNTWLNNNLGADYANVNSSVFDPTQQATAYDDYHAYGSLYQWGRYSDGHELINWTSATSGTAVNDTTSTLSSSDTLGHSKFIVTQRNATPYDWRSPQNDNLWQGEGGINNPCPQGYRLPTEDEWTALVSVTGITNYTDLASSSLKMSVSGYRISFSGLFLNTGFRGYYYSSSVSGIYARFQHFGGYPAFAGSYDSNRANGMAVRCIKD